MYRIVVASVLCSIAMPAVARANVAGTWKTSEGRMTLDQQGNRVIGRYGSDNGVIRARLDGKILAGLWLEDNSSKRCSTPRGGRHHWGTINFVFSGGRFRGTWGYCNDPKKSKWTGSRLGAAPAPPTKPKPSALSIAGTWKTSEGKMTLSQKVNGGIDGRYTSDNGVIRGSLKGNVLTGVWIEDNSAQRCASPRGGRHHWGTIRFVFKGNRFSGKWGYCKKTQSKSWTGSR